MDVRAVCLGILAPTDCGADIHAKHFQLRRAKAMPRFDADHLVQHLRDATMFDSLHTHRAAAVTHPAVDARG